MPNLPSEIKKRSQRKESLFPEIFQILQTTKANLLSKEKESFQQLKKFENNTEFNSTIKNKQKKSKKKNC